MIILSNGYKLPEDGDTGSVWFPALEDNIQRVNDHTHNGTNSELLIKSLNFASGSWGAATDGLYSQTKTIPTGKTYDNSIKQAKLANGDVAYLALIRASDTSITVKTNDNSQDINVVFE